MAKKKNGEKVHKHLNAHVSRETRHVLSGQLQKMAQIQLLILMNNSDLQHIW